MIISRTPFRISSVYGRFMSKVEKTNTCWIFKGPRNGSGYGSFLVTRNRGQKRTEMAHRVSWELFYGVISSKLCVLHRCDNRICVNPEHLFLGTHKDNTQDCIAKGRFVNPPHNHSNRKLSLFEVQQIQELYARGNGRILAKQFGVSQQTISSIICGIHWGVN